MSAKAIATVVEDRHGFAGVELRFPYSMPHPVTEAPLREWVSTLPGAAWDKTSRAWVVPEITDIPRGGLTKAGFQVQFLDGSPARPSDLQLPAPPDPLPTPERLEIPEWFGLPLYPYQRDGALAVAAGRRLLADAPGVGKTRTALAAAGVLGSRRTLVVCPPVVVTHWTREALEAGLPGATSCSGPDLVPPESTDHDVTPDASSVTPVQVVSVVPGRKVPQFPSAGVVVVGAPLLAARPELTAALRAWRPTVCICDEAHLAKHWGSLRSRVLRRLARSCPVTIPTTGTPVLASPLEVASLLEMAGMLESIYGTYTQFRSRFTRKGKWGWTPIKKRLPELRKVLDEGVWVRRTKEQVLADLPPKSRRALWVDTDGDAYQQASDGINLLIDEWIDMVVDATGDVPSEDDVIEWVDAQRGMVVKLRQAAGVSKVPAAMEWITDWISASYPDSTDSTDPPDVWDHPLVVWTHHHMVTEALVKGLSQVRMLGEGVSVIDGGVPNDIRTEIVDRFQAGLVPVLICSIQAAGVGITLTRAREALFVETDWTPAVVVQAEDRNHRIGQKSPVTYTTLIGAGTLDERVHTVLSGKASVVGSLMDGDQHVYTEVSERMLASDLLAQMVHQRIRAARRRIAHPQGQDANRRTTRSAA